MSEIREKASFDAIRYSQVWEDSDALLEALHIKESGTYLSIASAGDNALAMLSHSPKKVVALDLNQTQLFLLELKLSAFKSLEYHEVLEFLGVKSSQRRVEYFERLSLSDECRAYFTQEIQELKKGVNHIGRFEAYFKTFRTKIIPWIHKTQTVDKLLEEKSLTSQENFYEKTWNTWRWQLLFRLFFSKWVMGKRGRDKAFFNYVKEPVSSTILRHTRYALTELSTAKNPYLHYILKGNFNENLPLYLREENFDKIRNNLHKLEFHHLSIEEYLAQTSLKFDGFNLSDIFEYMSLDAYTTLLQTLIKSANPQARLVYWNMMVTRSRPSSLEHSLRPLLEEAAAIYKKDKTFFYKDFRIEEVLDV